MVIVPSGAAAFLNSPSPGAAPYRVLRIGVGGLELQTLNPNSMTLVMEYVVVYNVYSTLVTYDKDYKYHPDLANQWSLASDNVTWTFHLVHDAYFTNPYSPSDRSHQVTADDVVYSFELQMNNTGTIFNAYTTSIASVTKADAYTVVFRTRAPYAAMLSAATSVPIFPQYLWSSVWYPGCRGACDPVKNTPSVHPVGSNSLYFDIANSSITTGPLIFKRNPNYYGPSDYCQVVRPNEVRYLLYATAGDMVTEFLSGASKLDAVVSVDPPSYTKTLPASGTNSIYKWAIDSGFVGEVAANVMTPNIRSQFSQFNSGHNSQILQNQTVRDALAMSINRTALIQVGLLGLGTPGDTLVPDTNPWHYAIPSDQLVKFDPQAARALLNSQGWAFDTSGNPATSTTTPLAKAGGAQPLVFRFYTPSNHPEFEPMVANISLWLHAAGIQTTQDRYQYTPGDPTTYYYIGTPTFMYNAWKTADYDLWLWDWVFSPASDPSLDVLEVETTQAIGSQTSDNFYSNHTYDQLYNASLNATNPTDRRVITDQMQKMLYDYRSYILPFYEWSLYAATNRTDLGSGWENWGNWSASPALAPDSDLPPLFFQLYPHDNPPPAISSFPSISYVNGSGTIVSATAADPDGEPLSYVWDFGDGTGATTATNTVTHIWAQPGTYPVTVRVSDSEWPACASTTAVIISATAGQNLPPQGVLNYALSAGGHGWVNDTITFNLTVSDANGDEVNATWDFGDQSAHVVDHVTATAGSGTTVSRAHKYTAAGNYTVTVAFTDNKTGAGSHDVNKTVQVAIWKPSAGGTNTGPPQQPQTNPWINYGIPLFIVAVVVIAVAAVLLRRRKTMKDEEEKPETPKSGGPPPPSP